MNLKKLIVILLCVMLLSISATIALYSFYIIEDKKVVLMDVVISDHPGFNLDADAMHFGMMVSPGRIERAINVSHASDHPLKIDIAFSGDMKEWVYAEENGFILEPNVKVPVNIVLNVPEGVEMGDYDGYIIVYFKRVLFS